MKKILILLPNLPKYRSAFFEQLYSSLIKEDIAIEILHGTPVGRQIPTATNQKFPSRSFDTKVKHFIGVDLIYLNGMLEYVKSIRPDAIVFMYNTSCATFFLIRNYCLMNDIPYAPWGCFFERIDRLNSLIGRMIDNIRQIYMKIIIKRSTLIITYSNNIYKKIEKYGATKEKVRIAQNTIEVEKILLREKPQKRVFNSEIRVLFVGTISKYKYLDSSMLAIDRIASKDYNIFFDIVGDIPPELKLVEFQDTLKNKDRITLWGRKFGDELSAFFETSHVFLLAGAGGLALNEAMAYGLPIISTEADGTVPDLIDGNGYLISEFNDVNQQEELLLRFINLPAQEKEMMSCRSVEIAKDKCLLSNMVQSFKEAVIDMLH